MASGAGWFARDFPAAGIGFSVAVEFGFRMAVHAHHALLVVNVGGTAVLAGELGVNPAAVAEGAGLAFVLFHEFVTVDEAEVHAGYDRAFYMAVAAGGMTAPAGLVEDFCVIGLLLTFGKTSRDAVLEAGGRIMQGKFIGLGGFAVTGPAQFGIIGGPLIQARMGEGLVRALGISLMAYGAPLRQMGIGLKEFFIHYETLIELIRPNRGRSSCSAFSLGGGHDRRYEEPLHDGAVRMTADAA
jgi:hypothetical protein